MATLEHAGPLPQSDSTQPMHHQSAQTGNIKIAGSLGSTRVGLCSRLSETVVRLKAEQKKGNSMSFATWFNPTGEKIRIKGNK
ncbi:hypothetical protein [Paracnuella aquatica]|uniref:hypothetical protein n=1 Tax=Paracnuella aquatica TaxID=2268757 RepID=UPI000F513671|nr:hypothetical protein [Paracnuella aquatica]RPD44809.1 hypothetical protein DRJ53_16775 [Paracnuella aquatica]